MTAGPTKEPVPAPALDTAQSCVWTGGEQSPLRSSDLVGGGCTAYLQRFCG